MSDVSTSVEPIVAPAPIHYTNLHYELTQGQLVYLKFKYAVERFLALIAVVMLWPLFTIIPIIIKLDSEGPVFFKHKRTGYDLERFPVYKFRTMHKDAHLMQDKLKHLNEMSGGGLFKSDNDPRVTRVGRYLRKYSLDELPQLMNILRGEMTIIGPRPLSTPIDMYKPHQLNRFIVKPGLGCIWQAYHRGDTDFDAWMDSDLEYLEKIGPFFDLKMLFMIFKNALIGKGAR